MAWHWAQNVGYNQKLGQGRCTRTKATTGARLGKAHTHLPQQQHLLVIIMALVGNKPCSAAKSSTPGITHKVTHAFCSKATTNNDKMGITPNTYTTTQAHTWGRSYVLLIYMRWGKAAARVRQMLLLPCYPKRIAACIREGEGIIYIYSSVYDAATSAAATTTQRRSPVGRADSRRKNGPPIRR